MLIDFHTHCFPQTIAQKAIEKLSFVSGGLVPHTDGTVNGLKQAMAQGGADISVVLNIATNAHQQHSVNDFAAQINGEEGIVSFGSVFPHSEDVFSELERIKELGLKGVKLHPDYQGFKVDDQKMKPIYRKISELGLITVFHAGVDYGFAPPYCCMPENLKRALDWFDAPVVAAHWGSQNMGADTLKYLCGTEIYFDTAFGYGSIPKPIVYEILEKHGDDKVLFATDSPWSDAAGDVGIIRSFGLDPTTEKKIFCENAKALLGI